MKLTLASAFVALTLGISGCTLLPRSDVCVQADLCDQETDQAGGPSEGFGVDDPAFGTTGTCWQNDATAKPCDDACALFLAQEGAKANAPASCIVGAAAAEGEGEAAGQ